MAETIARDKLKAKIDRGDNFVLLDALPEDVYQRSHLPGALSMPAEHVRELAPSLVPDKQAEIVTYCMNPT